MTTFTDKELIKEIKERIGSLDVRDNIERRAYEIALASLEAEPVAYIFKHPAGKLFWALTDESNKEQSDVIPVYAAPPVPVVPEEKPMPNHLKMYAVDAIAAIAEVRGWNACRAAMLQSNQPVSQTYNLPELIEGMEVSIDVSTCDADLGNRYFGTVTEALELDTAKNGYILLVQDAEPNFDVNGNSPVTQDGWISCSERMPEIRQTVIGWNGYAVRQCVYTRNEYAKTQKGREPRFETLTGIWHGVTHWMPLPEPPQEAK
ncbi:TPA: DUF551 domain-containing protein [Escherichia coli]|nr:DUF551 domain-containing protein [Escherichia coli]